VVRVGIVARLAEGFAGDIADVPGDGAAMFAILAALVGSLVWAFKPRASLVAENLALRQQLATLRRSVPRLAFGQSIGRPGSCSRAPGRAGPTCWRSCSLRL
jgi:hypothetical protein